MYSQNTYNDDLTVLVNNILDESTATNSKTIEAINKYPEDDDKPQSVQDILTTLHKNIDTDKISKFNIFREDIFGCCIRVIRRKNVSPFHKISVIFSDIDGMSEGAVDEGGPTREMFRLILNYVKISQMFIGQTKKHITLNRTSLSEKHYYETGRLISLCLVHGGPASRFFSETLYSIVAYGADKTKPTMEDVEEEIKSALLRINECKNLSDLQEVLFSTEVFSIAGCNMVRHVEDKFKVSNGELEMGIPIAKFNFFQKVFSGIPSTVRK